MYLELTSVTKRYGAYLAVSDISFGVEKGERICLLGPSGCGKTTLLNMIAGFVDVSEGAIHVDGTDMTRVAPFRRDIGVVFQNYALFPHLTVEDNLYFGLKMRGISRQDAKPEIDRALALVRLEAFRGRLPNQLSGGQQQRVAIARAIVIRPRILLLDEPLSNLDAKLREAMREDLLSILDELSITTILVTHDQSEALSLCHRVAVMSTGKIEQIASPQEIYERPKTDFVASFVGESDKFDVTFQERRGDLHVFRTSGNDAIQAVHAPSLTKEEAARIFVRSERITVSREPGMTENTLRGTVAQIIYLGRERRVIVDVGGRKIHSLELTGPAVDRPIAVGDVVSVGWSAADSIVLTGK